MIFTGFDGVFHTEWYVVGQDLGAVVFGDFTTTHFTVEVGKSDAPWQGHTQTDGWVHKLQTDREVSKQVHTRTQTHKNIILLHVF